jgi:hypothetical protein
MNLFSSRGPDGITYMKHLNGPTPLLLNRFRDKYQTSVLVEISTTLFFFFFFFFFFFAVVGFELRVYSLSYSASPIFFFVMGFIEIESHKLFAYAGFQL